MAIRYFIVPYRTGSATVRAIRQAMVIKWIKLRNSAYKNKASDIIINWGANQALDNIPNGAKVVNKFSKVAQATNKLMAFRILEEAGVRIPPFTTDKATASTYLENDGVIVARTKLRGHGGSGIYMLENIQALLGISAPLYTKYIPKKSEYRVHVVNGTVIDVVRKALDKERIEREGLEIDWRIRNYSKGFLFSRDLQEDGTEVMNTVNADVTTQAINAVAALGLDFGAVDVIFNERRQQAYVLEVNTAPGIEGTTLDRYIAAFHENLPILASQPSIILQENERMIMGEQLEDIGGEEPNVINTVRNNR